jgi:hypothetical protein
LGGGSSGEACAAVFVQESNTEGLDLAGELEEFLVEVGVDDGGAAQQGGEALDVEAV